jgi:hypothetical protein
LDTIVDLVSSLIDDLDSLCYRQGRGEKWLRYWWFYLIQVIELEFGCIVSTVAD